tara:strand:- start:282 stop:452 length:171 start_codon:yes stop_codon:yes gene_type:complete
MFQINDMVKFKIGADNFIGQIVSVKKDVYLIRVFDNMHYHAHASELQPFGVTTSSV